MHKPTSPYVNSTPTDSDIESQKKRLIEDLYQGGALNEFLKKKFRIGVTEQLEVHNGYDHAQNHWWATCQEIIKEGLVYSGLITQPKPRGIPAIKSKDDKFPPIKEFMGEEIRRPQTIKERFPIEFDRVSEVIKLINAGKSFENIKSLVDGGLVWK